jgi:uncharacterized small protein (DUF1192 family)
MWRTLPVVLLVGCATTTDLPKQPDAPTNEGIVATVGKEWDTADQKVAASITIARENATKPEVVKAETSVALSYLPSPKPEELALARQRATKADQKDYAQAEAFGKKLLATIDANWAKVEADSLEAKRVSGLKDARIAELTNEVERVKAEASKNIWTITGAALAVIGGLACAFASPRIGIPILLAGAFCGAIPFIIDSPYFAYIAGGTLLAVAGLGIYWLWDKVRDSVNNDVPPSPK